MTIDRVNKAFNELLKEMSDYGLDIGENWEKRFREKLKEDYMEKKNLRFENRSPHKDPSYASKCDSGLDLLAWIDNVDKEEILLPLERKLIHTGIYCELPEGTEIQIRPKSGRALKEGLSVLNTPGTVDELYRGEICVIAVNLSNERIVIKDGQKVAQMVLMPVYNEQAVTLQKIDKVSDNTERGEGGFGHTGI